MKHLQALKTALLRFYSAPIEVAFRQFRAGCIYFAVGLGCVLMANAHIAPSITQELLVLGGLMLGGLGFVIAMVAQSRMLVGRLLRFWWDK